MDFCQFEQKGRRPPFGRMCLFRVNIFSAFKKWPLGAILMMLVYLYLLFGQFFERTLLEVVAVYTEFLFAVCHTVVTLADTAAALANSRN